MNSAIEVRDLRKTFGGRWGRHKPAVLDGLSLAVPSGSRVGVLGAAGSGKTTLARILRGQLRADSGIVQVLGEAPGSLRLAGGVGCLDQHPTTRPGLTGRAMLASIRAPGSGRQVDAMLEQAGLSYAADIEVERHSPCILRCFQLAQAMMGEPQLVILDEPGEALDPQERDDVLNLAERVLPVDATLLVLSRHADVVERLCANATILAAGKAAAIYQAGGHPSERGFRVQVGVIPEHLHEELVRDGFVIGHRETCCWIESPRRSQLNHLIDRVRAANVQIDSVESTATKLERLYRSVTQSGS